MNFPVCSLSVCGDSIDINVTVKVIDRAELGRCGSSHGLGGAHAAAALGTKAGTHHLLR